MNRAGIGLGLALGAAGAAALAAQVTPRRVRPAVVGMLTVVGGAAGVVAGVAGMAGRTVSVALPDLARRAGGWRTAACTATSGTASMR